MYWPSQSFSELLIVQALFISLAVSSPGYAQITLDGTVGSGCTEGLVCPEPVLPNGNTFDIHEGLGEQVGSNLFHSFGQFNVGENQIAQFSGPAGIANIISRITGGQTSNIDGMIRSTIAGANFFLINPAGVVFGAGAELDISGSFVVSTADELRLADGGVFSTADPTGASNLLTTAPPSAFGFLGANPASVSIEATTLSVPEGQVLSVISGGITTAGELKAAGGRVNLASVASAGEVALDATDIDSAVAMDSFSQLGDVELAAGTTVNTDGQGGGRVVIRASRLTIEDATITARTQGDLDGQGVDIEALDQFSLIRSKIDTRTEGEGRAGAVDIVAGSVVLDGRGTESEVGIFTDSLAELVNPLADLRVTLDISHQFVSDVVVTLRSPQGTGVLLFSTIGGSGNDFSNTTFDDLASTPITAGEAPFTGTFQPQEPLAILIGESVDGDWALELIDIFPLLDDGRLNAWSLEINGTVFNSSDVGQAFNDDTNPVISTLPIAMTGLLVPGTPGLTPGHAGQIHLQANQVQVFGDVGLSATAKIDAAVANIEVSAPAISLNGAEAGFAANDAGVGSFFVLGKIVIDNSFGTGGALATTVDGDFLITADLGLTVDTNLFHSFDQFSISQNQTAVFSGPDTITNIIARVTGGGEADIDGQVRSTIDGANLFIVNPAGVLFGPNAQLDIGGSFLVTTANTLLMGSTGRFAASLDASDSNLTGDSLSLSAFEFADVSPGTVSIQGSTLSVSDGHVLSVVGGNLTIGSGLEAPSGRVNLISVASSGQVTLDPLDIASTVTTAGFEQLGDIRVTDGGLVSVDGDGGGRIVVRGGSLEMLNGTISAESTGDTSGGSIDVNVTDQLALDNGHIRTLATGSGSGSGINIEAGSITADNASLISANTESVSETAKAGDIHITTGNLTMRTISKVESVSTGAGHGGNITVLANAISFNGFDEEADKSTGIFAETKAPIEGESVNGGDNGNIRVEVDTLQIMNGAKILNISVGSGNSGNVDVTANDTITIDGQGATFLTAVAAQTVTEGTLGAGGDIMITTPILNILNGGFISTGSSSAGDSGDLTVHAEQILLDEQGQDVGFTGLAATTSQVEPGGGQGGQIIVVTDDLRIFAGAEISVSTLSTGDAGSIDITAKSILIDRQPTNGGGTTGLFARSDLEGVSGRGGDIDIVTEDLIVTNGGEITSSTIGAGDSGNINVQAGRILIDADAQLITSVDVSSAIGNGGDIHITTDELEVMGSGVIRSTTRGLGDGGNIEVHAQEILLDDQGLPGKTGIDVTTLSSGDSGDITITTQNLQVLGGAEIVGSTSGSGAGSTIDIIAHQTITLDGRGSNAATGISAITRAPVNGGKGGDISVTAGNLSVLNGAQIGVATLGAGDSGTITINAGDILLDGFQSTINADTISREPADLTITLDISHPFDADVIAILESPFGTRIGLMSSDGGGGQNFTNTTLDDQAEVSIEAGVAPFSGTFRPEQPLSTFVGESANGVWVLELDDDFPPFDDGILNHWSLTVGGTTFVSSDVGQMFDGSAIVRSTLPVDLGPGAVVNAAEPQNRGKGGEININANSVRVLNQATITATTSGAGGKGGSITLDTSTFEVSGGGQIITNSTGVSDAGTITILAQNTASLNSGASISSFADSANGGNVTITAGDSITMFDSEISATAKKQSGGNINLTATSNDLTMTSSSVTAEAGEQGGVLNLTAGNKISLFDSEINAAADNGGNIKLTASTWVLVVDSDIIGRSDQDGGQISIDPIFVILHRSTIDGRAGGQPVEVDFDDTAIFLNSESQILTTAVSLPPELDLSGSLVNLPGNFVDDVAQLSEACAIKLEGEFSSFIVVGRGGVPVDPGQAQPGFQITTRRDEPDSQ